MIVVVKPAARSDILRQAEYYGNVGRRDVSEKFVAAVEISIDFVKTRPFIGSPRKFADESLAGLRYWPVKGFEAFSIYYITDSTTLSVVRILHGRRDIEQIFEDEG